MSGVTVRTVVLLLAVLGGARAGEAQERPLSPQEEQKNRAEAEREHLVRTVRSAVIGLNADGDRTMDAIENTQVKLTLDMAREGTALGSLCGEGGKTLAGFVQDLAGQMQLQGKVSEVACGGGSEQDAFVITFRLHYESGRTSLFSENPPVLPFVIEKPSEEVPEERTVYEMDRMPSPNHELPQKLPEPPPEPVTLNPRRTQMSHSTVRLPQGWKPVKIADPLHADSAFGAVDTTMSFADGVLTLDRKLVLRRDKVEVFELPAYQKWTESFEIEGNVALSSTLYYPERDARAGTKEQQKAADLIDQAYREIKNNDLAKAEESLNQAEAIDPRHEILHENRGELAEARKDYVTALVEYSKELETFPNALYEMSSIAGVQRRMGDTEGAIATLERWVQGDPNSSLAVTDLMKQYHAMGRDDFAVRAGDDAMLTMTKDAKRGVDFLMTYGHEQMLIGRVEGAKQTLEALLDLTEDPGAVNDAAFFLSEGGVALDRAERLVREALTQYDPENRFATAGTDFSGGPQQTSLLLSTWDTLGWILYRKGAVKEAERYVRAAWRSKQDIAIARHLGEILTAEEKPVEAMDVYLMGLAVGLETAMAKDPDAIAARASLAQLKKKEIVPTVTNAKAALVALRTLDLGPVAKPHGPRRYGITQSASELEIYSDSGERMEQSVVVTDSKLLEGFFPPDSKATLSRQGTVECSKTCLLVFAP